MVEIAKNDATPWQRMTTTVTGDSFHNLPFNEDSSFHFLLYTYKHKQKHTHTHTHLCGTWLKSSRPSVKVIKITWEKFNLSTFNFYGARPRVDLLQIANKSLPQIVDVDEKKNNNVN